MTQTESLIEGIRQFINRPVRTDELHQVKRCMLDWVGVSYAGAMLMKEVLRPFLKTVGNGPCTAFISERKLDVHSAAFLNGYVAHVLELDDGHRFGMLHLEAPVFSALFAVAQQEKIDFDHFVKGILVGYQTMVQLAKRIQPEHKKKGYHATGTCGTIGVACAVAAALDFTDSQFESAIGAAVTRAAGLLSALDAPSEIKPYNVASAVEAGICSAYLAKCGVKVQNDPIDGKRGFFKMYAPGVEVASLGSFAEQPEILNIYFKPYASCRHCHAPAECALNLKEKYHLMADDIASVTVETYRLAIDGHNHTDIPSASSAKMSIPYAVASALSTGRAGMDAFTEQMLNNPVAISLAKKVCVQEDEEMTALSPGKRGARVIVKTTNGAVLSAEVDNPLGEPEHPMSDDALEKKYCEMMNFAGIEYPRAVSIRDMIWNIENNYNEFIKVL